MYSQFHSAFNYLRYYLSASNGNGHGIHSPFVFDFITNVLNDKRHYPEYDTVELRQQLSRDQRLLRLVDLGAGSGVTKSVQRTVASIAQNAAKPKKFGQLLFRMVKKYQPRTILELGTSLGITSSYLALANNHAQVITLEGAGEVAEIAQKNFNDLNLSNCELRQGSFEDELAEAIHDLSPVGLAFIDGNHRQEPTERYFRQLLAGSSNDSIFIFDDIHWSKEMEQAWQTIQQHPAVRCSIDLFFVGVVLLRQEFREKQHFCVRF